MVEPVDKSISPASLGGSSDFVESFTGSSSSIGSGFSRFTFSSKTLLMLSNSDSRLSDNFGTLSFFEMEENKSSASVELSKSLSNNDMGFLESEVVSLCSDLSWKTELSPKAEMFSLRKIFE